MVDAIARRYEAATYQAAAKHQKWTTGAVQLLRTIVGTGAKTPPQTKVYFSTALGWAALGGEPSTL